MGTIGPLDFPLDGQIKGEVVVGTTGRRGGQMNFHLLRSREELDDTLLKYIAMKKQKKK